MIAGATGKARKWGYSASKGISALGAHIKRASGYGASAVAGGALGQTVASSTQGSFGFLSSGIMGGSVAAKRMAASGGIKAGSWYSILQSAGAGGVWAPCVLASSTCRMAVGGGFAYLAMTSIYKKIRG